MSRHSLLALRPDDPPELAPFVEQQRLRNLAVSTINGRIRSVRRLAQWLGKPLREASLHDLRRFVGRGREGRAPATQFGEASNLRSFYAALVELGQLQDSPAQGLEVRNVPSPRRPLSLERVQQLLAEASRVQGAPTPQARAVALRDRAVFELLFATGMRLSEVVAVEVVDLDLGDASVLVRRAKRGPSRRLPLPSSAVERLRGYLAEGRSVLLGPGGDVGALFLNKYGGRLQGWTVQIMVREVSSRCGAATYPHALRRTLATQLARGGVSLPVIQEVLGHADLSTTALYVQVEVQDMRGPLELLDRQRRENHPVSAIRVDVQCRLFNDWQGSAA